jgi:hypothetical protein
MPVATCRSPLAGDGIVEHGMNPSGQPLLILVVIKEAALTNNSNPRFAPRP